MRKPSYALFLCPPPPLLTITPFPHLNAPLSAAVESDTVGYTTRELKEGKWYHIAMPFASLNDSDTILLNDVFTTGFSQGDTLTILDSATSRYSSVLYWVANSDDGSGAWCDMPIPGSQPVTLKLRPGQAVYVKKGKTSNVTFSGKVEATPVSFGDARGNVWAQVAPVWPEAIALNDLSWSGITASDTITILDSETGKYSAPMYWIQSKNAGKGAWCDMPIPSATPVDYGLEPGQAVFIQKKSAGVGTLIAE